VTIAVLEVTLEEAKRFGILSTDDNDRITEFAEKPAKPKSTKASMGIYIFNKDTLVNYLKADEEDPKSSNDFGKNIIPAMIEDGRGLYAYPFKGYWKDVGTIRSLWEANMDLLGEAPELDLSDPDWKISFRHDPINPQYIGNDANISDSIIAEGCDIEGSVVNSVLFSGIRVGKGTVIKNSVIMPNVVIGENAEINYSILDVNCHIGNDVVIGEDDAKKDITVIGAEITIPDGKKVEAGAMIEEDLK